MRGVRGSTPAVGAEFLRYGGHTSCVALAHDEDTSPTLILDAGTGLRTVGELLNGKPFDGTILLSHLHWDHYQGLPFFATADREDARATVLLPEQPDGADAVSVLARAMSPPHFPTDPTGLRGAWAFATLAPGEHAIERFTVLAREIPHKGGRAFGYRVSDGHSAIAYLPDHCPTALGAGPDGCGEYHPAALELAAGVDLLIHDAQLTDEELVRDGRYGHSSVDYAVELGRRAGSRTVALFHHRPDRTDDALDQLARLYADIPDDEPPAVIVAMQGSVLEL